MFYAEIHTLFTVCVDKIADCDHYAESNYCSGIYEPWAKLNCEASCGFCVSKYMQDCGAAVAAREIIMNCIFISVCVCVCVRLCVLVCVRVCTQF